MLQAQLNMPKLITSLHTRQGRRYSGGRSPGKHGSSRFGHLGEAVDTVLTVSSCALYVLETYLENDGHQTRVLWVWLSEVVISASLLLLYVIRVCSSLHPLETLVSPGAILDLVTSAPVLVTLLLAPYSMRAVSILRVLRVLRTFSLAADLTLQPVAKQVTRPRTRTAWGPHGVARASVQCSSRTCTAAHCSTALTRTVQALVVALTTLSVVYIAACVFPLIDLADDDDRGPYEAWPFHDSLYFVIITITTVGYGDITPQSTTARLASLLMVATTFV